MKVRGSCHCKAVRFTVASLTPVPYMRCYCSICRKTQGGGGYAINIMGEAESLRVTGRAHVRTYRAKLGGRRRSSARRHFCGRCGSTLWAWDPAWPQWVYPFASAIDTPLPVPTERVHIMLDFKAPWVEVARAGRRERHFPRYPEESIADWHRRHRLHEGEAAPRRRRR